MSIRTVENEGTRVAPLRERSGVADNDNLFLEIGDARIVVDDSVETDIDDGAAREAGCSAMLQDGLPKKRGDGGLAGGPMVMMSGMAESASSKTAMAASM